MGRAPCCDKSSVKKGPWSPEEDKQLKDYIEMHGTGGNWIAFPHKAGLKRCGKSCRLRWLNYLRPNIKHGDFSPDEDMIICSLYASIGSRWSIIASQLPGRTDNDIKNYWNTKLKKKLLGIPPPPRKQQQQQQQLHMSQVIDTRPAALEAIISSAGISPNLINSLASSFSVPLLQNCSFFATDQDQYPWQRGAEPVELLDHNHRICGGDTTLTQKMLLGDSSSPSVSINFESNSEEVKPFSACMLSRINEGNCLDGNPNCYSGGAGEVRLSAAPAAGRCMYFY